MVDHSQQSSDFLVVTNLASFTEPQVMPNYCDTIGVRTFGICTYNGKRRTYLKAVPINLLAITFLYRPKDFLTITKCIAAYLSVAMTSSIFILQDSSTRQGREMRRSDSLSKGSWPFRSQSFDRANVNRRSIHLYFPENELHESQTSSDIGDSENVQVRNAQIRKISEIEDILRSSTTKKQR